MHLYIRFRFLGLHLVILVASLFFPVFAGNTPSVNVAVNIKNSNDQEQSSSATQTANLHNSQSQNQHMVPPTPLHQKMYNWVSVLSKYKYHILAGCIVASYAGVFAKIWADHKYIKRTDTWSSWKLGVSLEELKNSPKEQLCSDLIRDIQKDHILLIDPMNTSAPLAQFMQILDYEINRITTYLKMSTFLQRYKLLLIFPTNNSTIKRAGKKLERAQFIKQLFIGWTADYKMHHHLQMKQRLAKIIRGL